MPIYIYECPKNHRSDLFFRIADRPEEVECPVCGVRATQIPAIGGIEGESPAWLDNGVRECLQDMDRVRKGLEKPIETRKELRRRMQHLGVECAG